MSFCPEERQKISETFSISTPEKKPSLDQKNNGLNSHSPRSSVQKGSRSLTDKDFEIIAKSPFKALGSALKQPFDDIGVEIDPEKNIHGLRLRYLFGANEKPDYIKEKDADPGEQKSKEQLKKEQEIYEKMVAYFSNYYTNKQGEHTFSKHGVMWPVLYRDEERKIETCFTVQMHKGGRFIIPLKRGLNYDLFFEDLSIVLLRFLSRDEVELMLKWLFEQGGNENIYIHRAHAIDPDPIVEKQLAGAKIRIEIFGIDGYHTAKTYVDKSVKRYEIESEGKAVTTQALMDCTANSIYAASSLISLHTDQQKLHRGQSNILRTLDRIEDKNIMHAGQLALLLKNEDFHFNELDMKLALTSERIDTLINGYIEFLDAQKYLANINVLTFQEVQKNADLYRNLTRAQALYIGNLFKKTEEIAADNIDLVLNQVNSSERKIIHEVKSLGVTLESVFKRELDSVKSYLKEQLNSLHQGYIDNLHTVLEAINNLPERTSTQLVKDLTTKLKVSRSTVYRYIRKLVEKGLISFQKNNDGTPGRPAKLYQITDRFKTMLNSIRKKLHSSNETNNKNNHKR